TTTPSVRRLVRPYCRMTGAVTTRAFAAATTFPRERLKLDNPDSERIAASAGARLGTALASSAFVASVAAMLRGLPAASVPEPSNSSQRVNDVRKRIPSAPRGNAEASVARLVVDWAAEQSGNSQAIRSALDRMRCRTGNRCLASCGVCDPSCGLSFGQFANKDNPSLVTPLPPPPIPWQMTGNHWLALPCIHPGDASIHAVGVLHRAARAAIEFAGGAEFADGGAPPLARPTIDIDGVRHELSNVPMAWERALGWIPTFTCTLGHIVVRGTVFAPYGRDADVSGA